MNQIKPSLKQIKVLEGYCVLFFFSQHENVTANSSVFHN